MQADLSGHFTSHGRNGFVGDCTITLIDNADDADLIRRKESWRRVLNTVSPSYVLNTVT